MFDVYSITVALCLGLLDAYAFGSLATMLFALSNASMSLRMPE